MNSFERFNEEKLPARKYFYSFIKDRKIGDDSKMSDSHISVKDYLTCKKTCDKFGKKIWVVITTIILKKTYYY